MLQKIMLQLKKLSLAQINSNEEQLKLGEKDLEFKDESCAIATPPPRLLLPRGFEKVCKDMFSEAARSFKDPEKASNLPGLFSLCQVSAKLKMLVPVSDIYDKIEDSLLKPDLTFHIRNLIVDFGFGGESFLSLYVPG